MGGWWQWLRAQERDRQAEHRGVEGRESTPQATMTTDTCHHPLSKPGGGTAARVTLASAVDSGDTDLSVQVHRL